MKYKIEFFTLGMLFCMMAFFYTYAANRSEVEPSVSPSPVAVAPVETTAAVLIEEEFDTYGHLRSQLDQIGNELKEIEKIKKDIAETEASIAETDSQTAAMIDVLRAQATERYKHDPEFLKRFLENLDKADPRK